MSGMIMASNRVLRHLITVQTTIVNCFIFGLMHEFGVRNSACMSECVDVYRRRMYTFYSNKFQSTQCITTYCYIIRTKQQQQKKPHNDCASEMT